MENRMEYIKAVGTKIRKENGEELLLKGVGLGGWLLPEGYMWKFYHSCDRPRRMEQLIIELCGEEYNKQFWKKYRERYITKRDIQLLSDQGFNCVRLPLNSRILYQRQQEEIRWNEEELVRIDEFLCWCEEYGLYVILDMHGAPGGQTGTNIDDCERDLPELFLEKSNQDILCSLWEMLAQRYADRSCIAGYDLLNEPLPNWFAQYNDRVMPLYRRLTGAIRVYDQKHMIILEGVHWATEFEIFEELKTLLLDPNLVLQFHKYWNCPDRDSIKSYLSYRDRLQVPLLMGEGGENNVEWYTGLFSMLRRENISYCFWSYKKMGTENSMVSFPEPVHWERIIEYIGTRAEKEQEASASVKQYNKPDTKKAIEIFEEFLNCITIGTVNWQVLRATEGIAPLRYPAEFYSDCQIASQKREGALLRCSEPVSIVFRDHVGTVREPDYRRYGGEAQPEEEKLCVSLESGDWIAYEFSTVKEQQQWVISMLLKGGSQDKGDENETQEQSSEVETQDQSSENITQEQGLKDRIEVHTHIQGCEQPIIYLQVDGQEFTIAYDKKWRNHPLEPIALNRGKHTIRITATGKILIGELQITEALSSDYVSK